MEVVISEGEDYCGPIKTINNRFCLSKWEKLTKGWPGGSYLVMKITPRVPGDITLMKVGGKYNYRKVIGFVNTEGSGSNNTGNTYLSSLPDTYYNIYI